jgi:cell wall-associated NlpC family hydrolase
MSWRERVVEEALSWVGTPYHSCGDEKGCGVDCVMLLIRVYSSVGLIPPIDPRPYPVDWHLHRSEERFLNGVLGVDRVRRTDDPLPGDVLLFRYGRAVSHGAILVAPRAVVHAYVGARRVIADDLHPGTDLAERFHSAWTFA